MKKLVFIGIIALLFSACSNSGKSPAETTESIIDSNEPLMITVGSFDAKAAGLVGEFVTIKGTADHICKHDGKKLFLIDTEEEGRVKITAGEDVPAFNSDYEGYDFVVTGYVDEMIVDEEYLHEWEEEVIEGIDETRHLGGGQPMTEEERAAGVHLDDPAMEQIANYRKEMKEMGTDKLSFYSIICTSYEIMDE